MRKIKPRFKPRVIQPFPRQQNTFPNSYVPKTHFEQKVENHRLTLANTVQKAGAKSSNDKRTEDKTPPSDTSRSRNTRKTSLQPPPYLLSPRARKAIDLHLLRAPFLLLLLLLPPSQKPSNYRGTADKTAISRPPSLVAATINKPSAATEILRIVLKLRQLPPFAPPPFRHQQAKEEHNSTPIRYIYIYLGTRG